MAGFILAARVGLTASRYVAKYWPDAAVKYILRYG